MKITNFIVSFVIKSVLTQTCMIDKIRYRNRTVQNWKKWNFKRTLGTKVVRDTTISYKKGMPLPSKKFVITESINEIYKEYVRIFVK